jgi:2-polyprenyl-6-methoxyphenol hydroxylase-like FAD-dependent oxidoreductase
MNFERPFLVVGGGIAGMAAAIALARRGCRVDLVEADPDWRVYGAGITITGATYCAFAELGMLEELQRCGFGSAGGTRICSADGSLLAEVPVAPLRFGVPPIGGIMRPALHEMLSRETRTSGVNVRLGVSINSWTNHRDHVSANFDDGRDNDYGAIIIADGAFSKNRFALLPDCPSPTYTGQYCWRLVAQRPPAIDRAHIYSAGVIFAGLVPTSADSMYMWLLEPRARADRVEPGNEPTILAAIMSPFGGILGQLRDNLDDRSSILVRPLDALMVPRPWYRGRVLLIGDAAHATTPHLASGAGIAVEDALVIARLLTSGGTVDEAFAQFMKERWARCRDVVESSVAIGALQQSGNATPATLGALIGAAEKRLQVDIWDKMGVDP